MHRSRVLASTRAQLWRQGRGLRARLRRAVLATKGEKAHRSDPVRPPPPFRAMPSHRLLESADKHWHETPRSHGHHRQRSGNQPTSRVCEVGTAYPQQHYKQKGITEGPLRGTTSRATRSCSSFANALPRQSRVNTLPVPCLLLCYKHRPRMVMLSNIDVWMLTVVTVQSAPPLRNGDIVPHSVWQRCRLLFCSISQRSRLILHSVRQRSRLLIYSVGKRS